MQFVNDSNKKSVYFLEMCVSIIRSHNLVSFMKSNFNIDIKNQKLIIVERPIFRMVFDDFYYLSSQKTIQAKTHEIHKLMDDLSSEKDVINQWVVQLRKYVSSIVLSYVRIYGTTDLLEED